MMSLDYETTIEHHEYEKATLRFSDYGQDGPKVEIEIHDQEPENKRGNSRVTLTIDELRVAARLAEKYEEARKVLPTNN